MSQMNMTTLSDGSSKQNNSSTSEGMLENESQAVVNTELPLAPVPPPNGGLEAWLVVLAGFFIFMNSW
jgi:hypothetical protein